MKAGLTKKQIDKVRKDREKLVNSGKIVRKDGSTDIRDKAGAH